MADLKLEMRDARYELRLDKEKLEKVYESRNNMTVNLGKTFVGLNAIISAPIAFFVSFGMK